MISYRSNNLEIFPEEIRGYTTVTSLNLSDNKIRFLPEWLPELQQLKVLYLDNNEIEDIAVLTLLPSLEVLYLNNNRLKVIPDKIAALQQLRRLFVNGNQLEYLPDAITKLSKLEFLLVVENKIASLPENIGDLANLETLNLFDNNLQHLPDSIGNLRSLTYLQLSSNQLIVLPVTVGHLHKLTNLSLFSNQLKVLPESLQYLPVLRTLNIGDNKITALNYLAGSIEELSIYKNPLLSINNTIFTTLKGKPSGWLFADVGQNTLLSLHIAMPGRQVKLADLQARKIHPLDFQYMPQELVKQWQLERDSIF
nr:leucine-rich repeat domain-containing protein [Chitinophaga sp. Cy-1792]